MKSTGAQPGASCTGLARCKAIHIAGASSPHLVRRWGRLLPLQAEDVWRLWPPHLAAHCMAPVLGAACAAAAAAATAAPHASSSARGAWPQPVASRVAVRWPAAIVGSAEGTSGSGGSPGSSVVPAGTKAVAAHATVTQIAEPPAGWRHRCTLAHAKRTLPRTHHRRSRSASTSAERAPSNRPSQRG